MYIEKKYWDVLDKTNLVGKGLCQSKKHYKTGGIFYVLFLAPKMECVSTVVEFDIIQQHMTFKGVNDSKRILDRSHYFDMLEGKKISAILPRSWKKSIDNGTIIPVKMRRCIECKDAIICMICYDQVNENKEFEANLKFLKREISNQLGHMLPYYKK